MRGYKKKNMNHNEVGKIRGKNQTKFRELVISPYRPLALVVS